MNPIDYMNPNTDPLSPNYDAKARLYVRLAILYEKPKSMDSGDHPWRQICYFRRSQGNNCALVGEISKQLALNSLEPEITNVVLEWEKLGKPNG
jgi:hypothetical protein